MEGRVLVFLPVFSLEESRILEWRSSCVIGGVFLRSVSVVLWLKAVVHPRNRVLGAGVEHEQRRVIYSLYTGVCVAGLPLPLVAGEATLPSLCSRRNFISDQRRKKLINASHSLTLARLLNARIRDLSRSMTMFLQVGCQEIYSSKDYLSSLLLIVLPTGKNIRAGNALSGLFPRFWNRFVRFTLESSVVRTT